ncbi:MAG: AAA family ATPase [Krumholzibacteria bacterium]|nr:AAA family ATPase [Candidatus Krumholzibacteria bacterium]
MKLLRMKITNFRQFYGTQEIEFAVSNEKNVTVVHGFNGSGKTALLNAFVWCLYGETTPDFEFPERLENERMFAELGVNEEFVVEVALYFEANDRRLLAARKMTGRKTSDIQATRAEPELDLLEFTGPTAMRVASNGKACQEEIDMLLPRGLYRFFFFNGERVEWLASTEAYKEVESGIKVLLDILAYERAVGHLRNGAAKAISARLMEHSDGRMRELLTEETRLSEKRAKRQDESEIARRNAASLLDEIRLFEKQQLKIAETAEMAKRRPQLCKTILIKPPVPAPA